MTDIVQRIATEVELDPALAETALAYVFLALRFGLDAATYQALQEAVPQTRALVTKGASIGPRTSEIVAVTTPASLARNLERAGLSSEAVAQLKRILRAILATEVTGEATARVLAAVDRAVPPIESPA